MKRLIMLLLLLLCGLIGCGPKELSQEITEGTEETKEITTELVSASADAVSEDADAVSGQAETAEQEEQLAVLAKNRKQWLSHYTENGSYDSIFYTVTDMNQNGQLEVVTYICEGSGMFTNYHVNEVTEDGTVEEWHFLERNDGYDAHLDIGADRMTVYYSEEEETYAYLCGDTTGGIGGIANSPAAIVINGRTIEEKYFGCSRFTSADEEGVQYHDGDGKEITKKEYDTLVEKATPQGKKGNAYFLWECKSLEELLALSEEEIKKELTELSKGFLIRLEQKNNESYNKQIQYLVAHKKEWMKLLPNTLHIDDETIEASYTLMAMDLNQNGCMELGIEYYGKTLVFEVNKEADAMTEWKSTGESVHFSSACAYRSVKDDVIHFVNSGKYNDIYQIQLTDAVLSEGQVKTELISLADEEYPASYYDGEHKEITEEEYHDIEESFYKDLTPMKLYVQYIISPSGYSFDYEELNKLADEELTDMLQEGMECFYIG